MSNTQQPEALLARIAELEEQLSAIGAGGVEPLRKPASVAAHDDECEAFEKWARWACYDITRVSRNAQYESNITEQLWQCWQARAALAATPAADAPMVDITPPATSRDRWMYEQGRLAERDARTPGSVAAAAPVQMPEPVAVAFRFETEENGPTETSFYPSDRIGMGWTALYTEQQVRQLLAAHAQAD